VRLNFYQGTGLLTAGILVGLLDARGQITQAFDLTVPNGGSALINGAYFFPRYNTSVVSGSGTYGSYLKVDGQGGVGQGISNGDNGTYNNQSGVSLNNSLLKAPVNLPSSYWSFSLDINESAGGGAEFLALDDLKVFVSSTQVTAAQATTLAQLQQFAGNPVWDMDDGTWSGGVQTVSNNRTLLLDYLLVSGGSGNDDLIWLLPQNLIPTGPNVYVTIYTRFGTIFSLSGASFGGRDYTEDAGGEEWRTVSGLTVNIPPTVPEAGTGVATLALALGVADQIRRRRGKFQGDKAS
jgi:hypothetical protein